MNTILPLDRNLNVRAIQKYIDTKSIERCGLRLSITDAALYALIVGSTALLTASLTYWVFARKVPHAGKKIQAQPCLHILFEDSQVTYTSNTYFNVTYACESRDVKRVLSIAPKMREMNRVIPGTRAISACREASRSDQRSK